MTTSVSNADGADPSGVHSWFRCLPLTPLCSTKDPCLLPGWLCSPEAFTRVPVNLVWCKDFWVKSQLGKLPTPLLIQQWNEVALFTLFLIVQVSGMKFQLERMQNNLTLRINWELIKEVPEMIDCLQCFQQAVVEPSFGHTHVIGSYRFYFPNLGFLIWLLLCEA